MSFSILLNEPHGWFEHRVAMHINGYAAYADSYYTAFDAQTPEEELTDLRHFYNNWMQGIENQTEGILLFDLSDQYIAYLYFNKQADELYLEHRITQAVCGYNYTVGHYRECVAQVQNAPFDTQVVHLGITVPQVAKAIAGLLAQLRKGL